MVKFSHRWGFCNGENIDKMQQNTEFQTFIERWLAKAQAIELADLDSYFDKFFTLYVVYNSLYAEVTFILARQGGINLNGRNTFPDRHAATSYVSQFLGSEGLLNMLEGDPDVSEALNTIGDLTRQGIFSIKLNMITGERQREQDEALLLKLASTNRCERTKAILDTIYSLRCNMFHGHKGFDQVQIQILAPSIMVLEKLVLILRDKIQEE